MKKFNILAIDFMYLAGRNRIEKEIFSHIIRILNKNLFRSVKEKECNVNTKELYNQRLNELNNKYGMYEKIIGELCYYSKNKRLFIPGYCECCQKKVNFILDFKHGWADDMRPNWRERLKCPNCDLDNRKRFMYGKIKKLYQPGMKIWIAEQQTSMYKKLVKIIPDIIGSEFVDDKLKSGQYIKNVRHEDFMDLSFDNNSLDVIISQDVLEHVADFKKAFYEMYRVLRKGGFTIFTVPFFADSEITKIRAKLGKTGGGWWYRYRIY